MADSENPANRGGEQAKPEVNRMAELVTPVTPQHGVDASEAMKSPSFTERLGIAPPSPSHGDQASVQVAEEKTWLEKMIERNGKGGSGGDDQSWRDRVRSLPIEQQQEKENEREL